MLLPKIIGALPIESLFDWCLGQLSQKIDSVFDAGSSVVSNSTYIDGVSDLKVLRDLLPENLINFMLSNGVMGLHSLSFALRHQITYLNSLFHIIATEQSSHIMEFEKIFGISDLESDLHYIKLASDNLFVNRVPVIGFSLKGLHLFWATKGSCRCFDLVEVPSCFQLATSNLFCDDHISEIWWSRTDVRTTQSKMYQFYGDRDNFFQYDQNKLNILMNDFWMKFSDWKSTEGDDNLNEAMLQFGLKNHSQLVELGSVGLRKKFLQLSFSLHPDRGGTADDFVALKTSYEKLKVRI